MKVALIHDYLAQAGGAERVVAGFHSIYNDAPIYTSVYDPGATLEYFRTAEIRTSFLQKWPFSSRKFHKLALNLYPVAFERFDFDSFDIVLSSCSSFAKGVITGPDTAHVCYCHSPTRFAWRHHEYFKQSSWLRLFAPFMGKMLTDLRMWDLAASGRPDYMIANSYNVARRIKKCYRRDVDAVIHPPVDAESFTPISPKQVGNQFLIVSRLVGYKRVDLAVHACNKLQAPLRIVGSGPELGYLQRIAGPTIQFLGKLSDRQVAEYARCRAFILPGEEDFGITPLEAMASGRPVVAYKSGGALESVIDGQTGLFFTEQTPSSLAAALDLIDRFSFVPSFLREHAQTYDVSIFRKKISHFVDSAYSELLGSRIMNNNRLVESKCEWGKTKS
jgi:glycosyltransferase involved in cell wall biosynthesis